MKLILYSIIVLVYGFISPNDENYISGIHTPYELEPGQAFELNKPLNTWQLILDVTYLDTQLNPLKECYYYFIANNKKGKIVKNQLLNSSCKLDLQSAFNVASDITNLNLKVSSNKLLIGFTDKHYLYQQKSYPLNKSRIREFLRGDRSDKFKTEEIIFLKEANQPIVIKDVSLPDGSFCKRVDNISSDSCYRCQNSFYAVLVGGDEKIKYVCGSNNCGKINQIACPRGFKYQKQSKQFFCNEDPSFAICQFGLKFECVGEIPYCR